MIHSISVSNLLVFQRSLRKTWSGIGKDNAEISDDDFTLVFHDGINVLIGENGTGKTSLLKMIYAATQVPSAAGNRDNKDILRYFSDHLTDRSVLKNRHGMEDSYGFMVSSNGFDFAYNISDGYYHCDEEWNDSDWRCVFIPDTEMLSHSKGFLALYNKLRIPFDVTQADIITNASLPEPREMTPVMERTLEKISTIIDGTVIMENDVFYILKNDGHKVDFSLEAEGFRKLGLLWKLIRNGLLEPGSILLWDEPETNLNPELYPVLVDLLLELQRNKVQMIIATHSYNFAKYLEIRRTEDAQVVFHNLFWAGSSESKDHKIVCSSSAYTLEGLRDNAIMKADENLLDEVYDLRTQ